MDVATKQTIEKKAKQGWIWLLGGAFGLILLVWLLVASLGGHALHHVALHYDDTWKNLGAINGHIFFQKGKKLTAYYEKGTLWEMELSDPISIAYGENVYVLEKGGVLRVLDPATGEKIAEESLNGMEKLLAIPAGAYQKAQLVGCYPDHFTLLDEKGHPLNTWKTVGIPSRWIANEHAVAWTEETEDRSQKAHTEGEIWQDPNMPDFISSDGSETGGELVVQSLEAQEKEGTNFRTPLPTTGQTLLFSGTNSIIAADDFHFYFVAEGSLRTTIVHDPNWGCCVTENEIWAYSGKQLLSFDSEGHVQSSETLDFVPMAIVPKGEGVLVIGEHIRLEKSRQENRTVETEKFLQPIVQYDGRVWLLYEEEVVPVS